MKTRLTLLLALLILVPGELARLEGQGRKSLQKEEQEDYFKKWLNEDVLYIITDEEREVFLGLSTDEEKEAFIEQFWRRRDPTPETEYNEFKEEHYRRIQYANDHFRSGQPGWKTDRGMIYIKFGPPDRRERHPTGGYYLRKSWEGGGGTSTVPFEVWEYRYLEGVGQDVEIEFVDPTLTGEYRIAMNPDEKDALLHVPGHGLTEAEAMGLARRVDRIVRKTSPMPWTNPHLIGYGRVKDQPFEKLRTLTNLQRPPKSGFKDLLRPEVLTTIRYETLPVEVEVDYLPVDEQSYLVPITLVVEGQDLGFTTGEREEVLRSVLYVYGQVTSLSGQIVETFEESLGTEIRQEELAQSQDWKTVYQKTLQLPPGRYKLELILQDDKTQRLGQRSTGIILPPLSGESLTLSSVILADRIEMVDTSQVASPFGPARVFPRVRKVFFPSESLLVFFQISNFAKDPSTQGPSLVTGAEIRRGEEVLMGKEYRITAEAAGNRDRLHLVHQFDLASIPPGRYQVWLSVEDELTGQRLERQVPFQVEPELPRP